MWTDEEFGDHVRTKKVGKKMINKQIQITADGKVQSLDLKIEFDETDMDDVTSMTIKTNYQGIEILAIGTHYPFDDAFSDLQNKLPKNVQLKCCVACRHGNQCPVGNAPNEVFCTKDVKISCKSDCFYYTEDEEERQKRSRRYWDCCDDFYPQDESNYTYSSYFDYLKNQ